MEQAHPAPLYPTDHPDRHYDDCLHPRLEAFPTSIETESRWWLIQATYNDDDCRSVLITPISW
jgi:hypothetical protein